MPKNPTFFKNFFLHHVQDPSERLGSEEGALGVKQHSYFANTDWDLLKQV